MLELWLRKFSLQQLVFVSTDLADKQVQVAKKKQELDDLDDESTDIFKSNVIECYSIQPASVPDVDNLCLVQFAAYYCNQK